ncbi:Rho GTPase activation protein, partial [Chytriomyces sp. MP71]
GTDALSRPIFVFYACFLPDPSVSSYDDLLKALLVRFDALVSNDYVVVVFASGSRHRPKMTWLFRVYRQLERKFRKNLKKLYVVHPSPWFHLLMQVFGPIVSPKFTAKLAWIENMQVLAEYIPIMQVHVPRIIADSQSLFASSTTQFGVPLETLMGPQGARGLPRVVTDCIRFILANGLVTEGLFRVSPSLPSVMSLKELYNSGATEIQMDDYGGVHSACGLLKLFFRELPTPMFESNLYDTIRKIQSFNDTTEPTQLTYLKTILLPILAIPSYILLRALFQLLNQIHANEATTRMHSGNLAIVWAPNLCRSANPVVDLGMCAV